MLIWLRSKHMDYAEIMEQRTIDEDAIRDGVAKRLTI